MLKEKRQAVISHAATKGLDPAVPMKDSGMEWLGEVPAHWEVKRVKHIVDKEDGIQLGPFGGMLLNLQTEDTGFKLYGQENTISGDFSTGQRWLSEARFKELSRYELRTGDIVLTRKGSLGNARYVSVLPSLGIIDSDTIRLRPNHSEISAHFLTLLLHEAAYVAEQITANKRGAILSGLNTETVANITLLIPPMLEQNKIQNLVRTESHRLEQAITLSCETNTLLQERRSALISAVVTGKIDVRGLAKSEAA